ncbi:MAG: hypothetical protein ACRDV7_07715 [Acidimicrobiia bacterium]
MLTTVQSWSRAGKRVLGAGRVVELALGIVVHHEDAQPGSVRHTGEPQQHTCTSPSPSSV